MGGVNKHLVESLRTVIKKIIKEEMGLNEYDRAAFADKYNKLPNDRISKITDYSKKRQKLNGFTFTMGNQNVYFGKVDIYINKNQKIVNKHKTDFGYTDTIQIVCKNIVSEDNHEFYDVMNIYCKFMPGMGTFNRGSGNVNGTSLEVISINSEGNLKPKTPRDEVNFCNALKDVILNTFNDARNYPDVLSIKFGRNLFYK
jgi:hypothetical protein